MPPDLGRGRKYLDEPSETAGRDRGSVGLRGADQMQGRVQRLQRFAEELRAEGVQDVVLLGMGGSSLAPEMFARSFGSKPGFSNLHVLDSTDPATILALERVVDLKNTKTSANCAGTANITNSIAPKLTRITVTPKVPKYETAKIHTVIPR